MMKNKIQKITVLGDGGWGTTLAIYLAHRGFSVKIWSAFPEYARHLAQTRENTKFLPGIKIPGEIEITADLTHALDGAQLVILAIPSQFAVAVIRKLKKYDLSKKILLSVIKGLDSATLSRMSQIISKELGSIPLAVLSGPTIAMEIAKGMPSTAVIACKNMGIAKTLQTVFHSPSFRIYTNSDMVGVEIGGSIKNVVAIACGICDGLGFGTNAKAAILSRGLAEISRLGQAMGAKQKTFAGLSGLGDMVTTCFNKQSRNRSVGEQLGQGKKIGEITSAMDMVAEGVTTVKAAYALGRKYKVPMPITTEIFNIICKDKAPNIAVNDLMSRRLKPE